MTRNNGIEYKKTGEHGRRIVNRYHCKPLPLKLNKTPFHADIAGLKPIQQQRAILAERDGFTSKYTIGFEVEKTQFHRDAITEYEIFCGFETDSSCGYEAVTHVLPLLPAGVWRNKVYDMMYKAEKIIDDRWSPSDRRCGGHITCTVVGMPNYRFLELLRPHMGIIMSLWRGRLKNQYCSTNITMLPANSMEQITCNPYAHDHYRFVALKCFNDGTSGLEFRVPSRFQSVKQMMRRYELFYELIDFAVSTPRGTHEQLMKKVYPLLLSLYNGNVGKAAETVRLAKFFRKFILTNKINAEVGPFVDPERQYTRYWEPAALRAAQVVPDTSGDVPDTSGDD